MAKDPAQRYQTPAEVAEPWRPGRRRRSRRRRTAEMPRLSLAAMGGSVPETSSGTSTPTPPPIQRPSPTLAPKPANAPPTRAPAPAARPAPAPTAPAVRASAPAPRPAAATTAPVAAPAAPSPTRQSQAGNGSVNWNEVAGGAAAVRTAPKGHSTIKPGPGPSGFGLGAILRSMQERPRVWLIIGGGILLFVIIVILVLSSAGSSSSKFSQLGLDWLIG